MRRADLQAGEAIQRALEDEVRQRDRRLERVADRVREQAVAIQPAAALELRRALRVNEDQGAELLRLRPEWMELRIAQLHALDAAAEAAPAQPVLLHPLLELLGREVGVLQGHRRERDEPVRMRRAELGQLLVLQLDQLRRDVAIRVVPVRIDAERLDVDALRVHRADAIRDPRLQQELRLHLPSHERHGFGERAVRVYVHRLHTLAVHHHVTSARLGGARPAADRRA